MKPLSELLRHQRQIRCIAFDDGPHQSGDVAVPLAGVVCSGTHFEGLLITSTPRDGHQATQAISARLLDSRYHEQVHAVLLDGVTMAGLDVVDLQALHAAVDRPILAVLRRAPNLDAFHHALAQVDDTAARVERLAQAGPLHTLAGRVFHVVGAAPADAAALLDQLCIDGLVPEPLRFAHQIAGALVTGESGRRP